MNVPIVAGDVVDDGGFQPRFVRVSVNRHIAYIAEVCIRKLTCEFARRNFTVS